MTLDPHGLEIILHSFIASLIALYLILPVIRRLMAHGIFQAIQKLGDKAKKTVMLEQ